MSDSGSLPEDEFGADDNVTDAVESLEGAGGDESLENSISDTAIAQLQTELAEANERAVRTQADMENLRRRTRRELEDERRYAASGLLQDLLPAIDNLNRAIEAAQGTDDAAGLLDGIKMVLVQLSSVLTRHQCEQIDAKGQPFDPDWHEAIGQVPSADCPPGTVVEEAVTGYRLHDRVIRASQVLVSIQPPEPPADESSEE